MKTFASMGQIHVWPVSLSALEVLVTMTLTYDPSKRDFLNKYYPNIGGSIGPNIGPQCERRIHLCRHKLGLEAQDFALELDSVLLNLIQDLF
jgi:hypothetical protein